MTAAQAETVAAALIAAGYNLSVTQVGANWTIVVTHTGSFDILVSDALTFANANGVIGKATTVQLS
jgi:hypothetical protein